MMNAANRPVMQIAANPVLPQDLLLDLAKKQSVQDTVFITKTDTIKEQVTKVKWKKVAVPSPVIDVTVTSQCRIDTVEKPVYYIYFDMTGSLPLTNYMGYQSEDKCKEVLKLWNKLDPVSDVEKLRNNTVQKIQGNRNPFVDYPELVDQIFE